MKCSVIFTFIKESEQFSDYWIDDILVKNDFWHQDIMSLMLIFRPLDHWHLFRQLGSLQVKLTVIAHIQMKMLLAVFYYLYQCRFPLMNENNQSYTVTSGSKWSLFYWATECEITWPQTLIKASCLCPCWLSMFMSQTNVDSSSSSAWDESSASCHFSRLL